MAGTTGLEPATSAVTGQRSNQLSYVPKCISLLGYVVHRTDRVLQDPCRRANKIKSIRTSCPTGCPGVFLWIPIFRPDGNYHREASDIFAESAQVLLVSAPDDKACLASRRGRCEKLFISLRLGDRALVIDLLRCGRQAVFVYAVDKRPSADIEVSSRLRLVTTKPFQCATNQLSLDRFQADSLFG